MSGGGIEREEEVGETPSLPPISTSVESKGDILKQFNSFDWVIEWEGDGLGQLAKLLWRGMPPLLCSLFSPKMGIRCRAYKEGK